MSNVAVRGALASFHFSGEKSTPMTAFNRAIFWEQYPLTSRVPRVSIGADSFEIITHKPRTEDYTLATKVNDDSVTSFSLTNGSPLMPGDVLRIHKSGSTDIEVVEVQSVTVTNTSTGAATVVVKRGAGGTTPFDESSPAAADAIPTTAVLKLIGNSRVGNEINQQAIRTVRTKVTQYCQRYQHPVEVGGRVLAIAPSLTLPNGANPLAQEQADKLVNLYEDMERTALYGFGVAASASERAKSHGLYNLVGNRKLSATNPSAYAFDDLVTDVFAPVANNGGKVDTLLVTPHFFTVLNIWGYAKEGSYQQSADLGPRTNTIHLPLHGRQVEVIPCPKLGSKESMAVVGFAKENLRLRVLEEDNYKPRGRRGDAVEGDFIADNALELLFPEQAAWVEGITAGSAT